MLKFNGFPKFKSITNPKLNVAKKIVKKKQK